MTTFDHGDAKNTTECAISSWGGISPSGMRGFDLGADASALIERFSDSHWMNTSTFGPPIQPGATPFTRTRAGPSSSARACTAVRSAPFDVEYAPSFGRILRIDIERMNTIDASPRSAAADAEVGDARLREAERAPHVDLVHLAPVGRGRPARTAAPRSMRNALFTRMSMPPNSSTVRADERVDRFGVDEVRRDGERAPALALDLGLHLLEVLGVARREHDRRTFARERVRVRLPEPRADAGDDRYLAVEEHRGGSEGARAREHLAHERLEVLERQRVVVGVERGLVPVVGELRGEVEPRLALVLGPGVGIAAEVARSSGDPGSPGGRGSRRTPRGARTA